MGKYESDELFLLYCAFLTIPRFRGEGNNYLLIENCLHRIGGPWCTSQLQKSDQKLNKVYDAALLASPLCLYIEFYVLPQVCLVLQYNVVIPGLRNIFPNCYPYFPSFVTTAIATNENQITIFRTRCRWSLIGYSTMLL